jgi:hypothetical protein
MEFWHACSCRAASRRRAAKQERLNADAVRCTLMHADGTGATASARLPGCGCSMSAVKHRAGPRPICVHRRASFCICVESFFPCRVPRCRRPGEAWLGTRASRCAFWCMGCFLRGSDWLAVPGDGRIGAWGPGAGVFRALAAGRRTGLPPRCMGFCRGVAHRRLRQAGPDGSIFRCMGFCRHCRRRHQRGVDASAGGRWRRAAAGGPWRARWRTSMAQGLLSERAAWRGPPPLSGGRSGNAASPAGRGSPWRPETPGRGVLSVAEDWI